MKSTGNRKKGSGGAAWAANALSRVSQAGRDAIARVAGSVALGQGTRQLGCSASDAYIASNAYRF